MYGQSRKSFPCSIQTERSTRELTVLRKRGYRSSVGIHANSYAVVFTAIRQKF